MESSSLSDPSVLGRRLDEVGNLVGVAHQVIRRTLEKGDEMPDTDLISKASCEKER